MLNLFAAMSLFAFFTPGPVEIGIVCAVVLLLFGPKQLPKIARSFGSIGPQFRAGMKEAQSIKEEVTDSLADAADMVTDCSAEAKRTVTG